MIDWYQVRYWVNGLALLAVLLLPVLMIFISAMSKMSRRGGAGGKRRIVQDAGFACDRRIVHVDEYVLHDHV